MQYVTDRLIEQVYEEIATKTISVFLSHALVKAQAKDEVRLCLIRLILEPLADRLLSTWGKQGAEDKGHTNSVVATYSKWWITRIGEEKVVTVQPFTDERGGELPLFSLEGLLPVDQRLSVNTHCLVVSLVSTNSTSGNPILRQRLLTESQLRLLLTLLQSPHYCPHEVLYAGLFCSYSGLLAGLFSSEPFAREEWLTAIWEAGLRLEQAAAQGILRKELKQLYNSLSALRAKLRPFDLSITISTSGSAYALIPLPLPQQEGHEAGKISPFRLTVKTANLQV